MPCQIGKETGLNPKENWLGLAQISCRTQLAGSLSHFKNRTVKGTWQMGSAQKVTSLFFDRGCRLHFGTHFY